ncbi:glycoside hydrolase family 88 protein [Pseudoduganella rivuli]|nr:glycoside hydrolase family 88 protein [Pseudoduganella rivuli]
MTSIHFPKQPLIAAAVCAAMLAGAMPGAALAATLADPVSASAAARALTPAATLNLMQRVADWQLAHPSTHPEDDWTQAVGDAGFMALAGVSGERRYRDAMAAMGERNQWKLGPSMYHADDYVVGQTYAELYLLTREPKMIAPMRAQFDYMLDHPREGGLNFSIPGVQHRWSWCDALFMGPPAWARLYAATGDERYLNLAVEHWWRTSDYLYDKEEHLYYRDSRYFGQREANGKKVFWGRGNGWVMGGLVRMLQYLPAHHPSRERFVRQFTEMAGKLLTLQQADGTWRASLLDPASYPLLETSGTGLYTYALAFGVNQGLLDRATYGPAVRKAWDALVVNVNADGKLTHVQPIGQDPKSFDPQSTEVYGVGAFLMAGSELYRMQLLDAAQPQVVQVTNGSALHRADESVEADAGGDVAVMDAATSRIVPSQGLGKRVLFQATLAPGETRRYLVLPRGALPAVPPVDAKAHARFVPERLDDFAWESDRTAHRVYGPAIATDPKEMLTSSGVDVWSKRTRKLVLDNWYGSGDYHTDKGDGLDFYKVGKARGCGGLGVFDGKQLYTSANFTRYKVLADGPLRAVFELTYDGWDAAGRKVNELRRVSIDAGSNFSRVESRFGNPVGHGAIGTLDIGVGIVQREGEGRYRQGAGWMSYWEPPHGGDGHAACAVVLPDARFVNNGGHYLALGAAAQNQPFVYYMGAGWSKSPDFPTAEAWERHVQDFAARVASPVKVTVQGAGQFVVFPAKTVK